MAHLIDKSALVAEIERRKKAIVDDNGNLGFKDCQKAFNEIDELKKFVGTLEVKEVQEITASDRGMAEEIIINLKRVEQDYCIDLTKEMEWLRNKVKKGEEV